jgi:hypothetical protein
MQVAISIHEYKMSVFAILANLSLLAGLLAVFLTWQRKGVRTGLWRFGLPAGWGLMVLGLCVWTISTTPDHGLALGSVALMVLAGAILTWQGLKLANKPSKTAIERESATDTVALGKGYWGRFTIRLLSSLIIVPAVSVLLGILWQAYIPASTVDKLVGAAIAAIVIMSAALTWQLASRHPYRTFGALTAIGTFTAAAVYLPLLLGAGA